MNNNLLYFQKPAAIKEPNINLEKAKRYFVEGVLPYTGKASLLRLMNANISGDMEAIKLEMTRMFIEAEIMKPVDTETTSSTLQAYFSQLE